MVSWFQSKHGRSSKSPNRENTVEIHSDSQLSSLKPLKNKDTGKYNNIKHTCVWMASGTYEIDCTIIVEPDRKDHKLSMESFLVHTGLRLQNEELF